VSSTRGSAQIPDFFRRPFFQLLDHIKKLDRVKRLIIGAELRDKQRPWEACCFLNINTVVTQNNNIVGQRWKRQKSCS